MQAHAALTRELHFKVPFPHITSTSRRRRRRRSSMRRDSVCDIVEIYELLYRLGLSADTTAFFHLSFALYLAARTPHWLVAPSQCPYPQVAARYRTDSLQVYRSISALTRQLWQRKGEALRALARQPLSDPPSTPQILAVLALSLREKARPPR